MRIKLKRTFIDILLLSLFLSFLIFEIFPILWTISTSIKPPELQWVMPPVWIFPPTLENYILAIEGKLTVGGGNIGINLPFLFTNSVIITLSSVILSTLLGYFGGYAFARLKFKFSDTLFYFILFSRIIPPIGVALPLMITWTKLGLYDTHISLVLTYTAINLPLSTAMMMSCIKEIPVQIEEAALIDGCSQFAVLKMIFRLLGPAIGGVAALSFATAWNDFDIALYLTRSNAKTLPLAVMGYWTDVAINWGPMMSVGTIILVPSVIFYTFFLKYIVRGLASGAIKG